MDPISIILGLFIAGVGVAAAQQREEQQKQQHKKMIIKAEQEVIKKKQQEQLELNYSNIKCPHCNQNIKLIY